MVMAPLCGVMDLFSKDSFSRTILMDRVTIGGLMGASFMATGKTTR